MAMRLTCLVLALAGAAHGFHAVPVAASAHRLHSRPAAASHAVRSAGAPAMGLMDSLKNFFRGEEAPAKCAALLARTPPHALRSATARVRVRAWSVALCARALCRSPHAPPPLLPAPLLHRRHLRPRPASARPSPAPFYPLICTRTSSGPSTHHRLLLPRPRIPP